LTTRAVTIGKYFNERPERTVHVQVHAQSSVGSVNEQPVRATTVLACVRSTRAIAVCDVGRIAWRERDVIAPAFLGELQPSTGITASHATINASLDGHVIVSDDSVGFVREEAIAAGQKLIILPALSKMEVLVCLNYGRHRAHSRRVEAAMVHVERVGAAACLA